MPVERAELDRLRLLALGDRIRQIRTTRKLSQEEVAHRAGLHRTVVGFIEQGRREIGVLTLWPLAEALDVSVADLFS
jgi:transcriptional regulator with XRE-family HTH domain